MTGENVVERLRAYAVAPAGMPGVRFHGRMAPEAMTVELVRLTFANGAEGVASSMSGSTKGEGEHVVTTLARLAERVVGADGSPDSPLTGELIEEAGEGPWPAISIVDCALWDARARDAGQPLWRLLGGRRDRLPAYASTPAWLSVDAYLDEVRRLAAAGYRAIKFHMNTDPEFDLEMVRAVAGAWADSGLRFMADMEQLCTFDEAVRLGETLSGLPFDWLEAPLPDTDLDAYAELNRAVGIDVLAAGNTLVGMENWKDGLERKAWSRLRCDASNAGGITGAIEASKLARAMGVPIELQSYGFQPAQRANLQVMLGMPGCTWFEQPVPREPFDHGALTSLALDEDGCVAGGGGPGTGIVMDWDAVEADAFAAFDSAAAS